MLAPRPELERQLETARQELIAAQAQLSTIAEAENDALATAKTHSAWRAKHETASAEVGRLSKLVASMELEAAHVDLAQTDENLRRQHAEKKEANAALAIRIRDDLARINELALPLLRALAVSTAEDLDVNSRLPDDLEPIVGAEFLARAKPALPREEIASERVLLWTKADNGFLIGDQNAVEDRDNGLGTLRSGVSTFSCVKNWFEQKRYHPAEPMERPTPLLRMQLPQPDGPSFAFDGSRLADPRAVLAALDRSAIAKLPERPVEIELTPIPSPSDAGIADSETSGEAT